MNSFKFFRKYTELVMLALGKAKEQQKKLPSYNVLIFKKFHHPKFEKMITIDFNGNLSCLCCMTTH